MDDRQLSVVEQEDLGERFESAEARYEYEKALRLRRVLKWVGGLLALVAFGFAMYWLGGGGRKLAATGATDTAGADTGGHGASRGPAPAEPVGSQDAKVKVVAILPTGSGCHNNIIRFLTETASRRQDEIRVDFTTMDAYGQQKLQKEVGSSCAAVMINGKTDFELTGCGEPHKVSLVGTEPTHYSLKDVGEALTSVFVQEYGDPGQPIYVAPAESSSCAGSASGGGGHGPGGAAAPGRKPGTVEDSEPLELPGFREIKAAP